MKFDEALEAAIEAKARGEIDFAEIHRRFVTAYKTFGWEKPRAIKTEWNAHDHVEFCSACRREHLQVWQDGDDGHDMADSVLSNSVCIEEARRFDDWKICTQENCVLEDWEPPVGHTDRYGSPHWVEICWCGEDHKEQTMTKPETDGPQADCSGCLGGTVSHTCGRSSDADTVDLSPARIMRIREHGDGVPDDKLWSLVDALCAKIQDLRQDQQDYMGSLTETRMELEEVRATEVRREKARDGAYTQMCKLEVEVRRLHKGKVNWTLAARTAARPRVDALQEEPEPPHLEPMQCGGFLLHLVDVVWGDAMEDGQVPCTLHALKLIAQAEETLEDS